jgi:hypothetical protein
MNPEMNPRIRLLALQAGSTHKQNLGVYQFYTDELEKFAQLIVAECMQLNSQELSITAIERLLPMYQEHFGVEP